jgi:hypothetical protein
MPRQTKEQKKAWLAREAKLREKQFQLADRADENAAAGKTSFIAETNAPVSTELLAKRMRKRAKTTASKERFLTWRMWGDTLLSFLRTDRGSVPQDIGDRLYVGNNMYVTKNSLTSVVVIEEFSTITPIATASAIIKEVKDRVPECTVDVQFRTSFYQPDFGDAGLQNRYKTWERQIDSEDVSERTQKRAARQLYTYEQLRTGMKAYKVVTFVYLRGQNAATSKRAVKVVMGFARTHDIIATHVKSNFQLWLPFMLTASKKAQDLYKDIPRTIMSSYTLAQSLPVTQGVNMESGVFMGIDNYNGGPYYIDFRQSAKAKNIYVVGMSGHGKTFMVLNWLLSAFADDYGACVMDIKGNEFTAYTNAVGGKVISMKPGSTCYVNRFKMDHLAVSPGESDIAYFNNNIRACKNMLEIIVDPEPYQRQEVSGFLEEFMHAMYLQLGVEPGNRNTWNRTRKLTPAVVYEYFVRYLSADVRRVYSGIIMRLQMTFAEFLSPSGSESTIFANEYDVKECMDARVITFDYGMLNAKRISNPIAFKLRCSFMETITDEFILNRKRQGLWTMVVEEESQLADEFLKKMYTEAFTIRRAQNCVTLLLGNSVASMKNDPMMGAMMDNITMFCIGRINRTARNTLMTEYGLDDYEETLAQISNDSDYEYKFLFLNRNDKSTAALLSVEVPKAVRKGKLFKNTDTVEKDE